MLNDYTIKFNSIMKKMKTTRYIAILLTGILLFSCSEEFLDKKPLATINEGSFYTTMSAVDMATTVCYSDFVLEKIWDLSIMMTMGSIASDEAEAGAGGKADVIEYQMIDQLRHTPETPNVLDWVWGYLYRTINYCNVAIERIPDVTPESDPEYDAAVVDRRLGEVRFLRAYNYFTMTQIFGGVPLILNVLPPSEYRQSRAEISDIYAAIKADLKIAITKLPENSVYHQLEPGGAGRATKGAAKALLAKVYLFESSYAKYQSADSRFAGLVQRWDSAAYWAEEVINSGEYQLVGMNGEKFSTWRDADPDVPSTNAYQWIFMKDGNNSPESVFEIQARQDNLGWFDTRGTALVRWCAPRKLNLAASGADGSDYGWGWWCPTDFLVNAYEAGDPRYKATVMEEGDSVLHFEGWVTPNFNILETGTGLHRNSRKYECSPAEYWNVSSNWQSGPIDVKLIRYADVVLWAAEANFEMGNQSQALVYINMVR
jgi:hypothetical protein